MPSEQIRLYVLVAALSAGSGYGGTYFRADKFTGTEGKALQAELDECRDKMIRHLATPHPPLLIDRQINRNTQDIRTLREKLYDHR